MSEQSASAERETIAVLRAAAAALRRVSSDPPRGPWRWGDPDVDGVPLDEPPTVVTPSRYPGPLAGPSPLRRHDPLDPFPDGYPPLGPRIGSRPASVLDTAVVEPLAALLDVLASRVDREEHGVDPETARAAVAVARVVLRSCTPAGAGGPG